VFLGIAVVTALALLLRRGISDSHPGGATNAGPAGIAAKPLKAPVSIETGAPTPGATNDPAALVEEGTTLFYKGDPQAAVAKYLQALELNRDDEEIHFNIARAYSVMRRTNEAMRYYEEALRILPDYAEAHNNLGNLLVGLRRHQEALEHFSAALKVNPDNSSALNNLGRCLAELGQTREAVVQFTEAVRLHPEYLEGHFNLAAAQASLGNFDEAITHYEKVLHLEPDFAPAQEGLRRVKARQAAGKAP